MSKGELKWREEVQTRLRTLLIKIKLLIYKLWKANLIFDKSYCCDVEYLEGLWIKRRAINRVSDQSN
jgi:hypothetical protein